MDARTLGLVCGVLVVLGAASMVVRYLGRRADSGLDPAIVATFRLRVRAWWVLFAVLAGAMMFPKVVTIVLFCGISFWALREFITLTPTRPGDHRALFWVFFICTPLQFLLVGMERWLFFDLHSKYFVGVDAYAVYSILIPVYAFLLIPLRIAIAGDPKRFLERTAKIQSGLLICVYCLSYAPALLTLDLREAGDGPRLLFFFVLMVQLSDALQYAWAQLPSRHVIAPAISPSKTWEGFLGGTASVTLLGTLLWFATPFEAIWQATLASAVVAVMGFAGSLTMSAIKRDRGVKDYGTLIEGHGGVLDRIDSICFAAPVFFHLSRMFVP